MLFVTNLQPHKNVLPNLQRQAKPYCVVKDLSMFSILRVVWENIWTEAKCVIMNK